jgi:spore germination protein GerM
MTTADNNSEEIIKQQELLTTYRRTLAHLLQQAARYGGVSFAPPQTAHGIDEARDNIRRIKDFLRERGVGVEDKFNDEAEPAQQIIPESIPGRRASASIVSLACQYFTKYKRWLWLALVVPILLAWPILSIVPRFSHLFDANQPTAATTISTSTIPLSSTISMQLVTLYFADVSGTLLVPVQREVKVENNQVLEASIRALIEGPRQGLLRLLPSDMRLLNITVESGTATVNFDRRPTLQGDDRGINAIALTLTHFPSIHRVQLQINGRNIGGPLSRPLLNLLNPDNLPMDFSRTDFLPLYFLARDGRYDIKILRLVPKTKEIAEAIIQAILNGPGEYADRVHTVIPEGTALRDIGMTGGTIIVDFNQTFTTATDRDTAVRTVVESLTSLASVKGVQILVEGASLGDHWGSAYGKVFLKPVINPE